MKTDDQLQFAEARKFKEQSAVPEERRFALRRCSRLVLTDHTDWECLAVGFERMMLICFDTEALEVWRERGVIVRHALDYATVRITSFQALFECYAEEPALYDLKSVVDFNSTLFDHLIFKAAEVYAPILWVWEIVERILAIEPAATIRIELQDPWLKTVIENIVEELGAVQER